MLLGCWYDMNAAFMSYPRAGAGRRACRVVMVVTVQLTE